MTNLDNVKMMMVDCLINSDDEPHGYGYTAFFFDSAEFVQWLNECAEDGEQVTIMDIVNCYYFAEAAQLIIDNTHSDIECKALLLALSRKI